MGTKKGQVWAVKFSLGHLSVAAFAVPPGGAADSVALPATAGGARRGTGAHRSKPVLRRAREPGKVATRISLGQRPLYCHTVKCPRVMRWKESSERRF